MNDSHCDQETRILEALRSGPLQGELERHIRSCARCAELLLVHRFLGQEAEAAEAGVRLPDAGTVWRRAQRRAREEQLRKAVWPIALVQRVAWGLGAALLLGAGFLQWSTVSGWFVTLSTLWPGSPDLISAAGRSPMVLALGPVLAMLLFELFWRWSEESG